MKWGRLEPTRGGYNWGTADQLVEFAARNGQQVYGHTWSGTRRCPAGCRSTPSPPPKRPTLLSRHITDVVSRYRGKVWAWDVVNEPLEADGSLRATVWRRTLGPDYIERALRWARAADPNVRLFINDFGIEGVNEKSDALYALVKRLRARGVPIDGIGFQTHTTTARGLPESFSQNLQRFAALGLDVAVTEADVRIPLPVTDGEARHPGGPLRRRDRGLHDGAALRVVHRVGLQRPVLLGADGARRDGRGVRPRLRSSTEAGVRGADGRVPAARRRVGSAGAQRLEQPRVAGHLQDVVGHPAVQRQQQVAGRAGGLRPLVRVVVVEQRVGVEQGDALAAQPDVPVLPHVGACRATTPRTSVGPRRRPVGSTVEHLGDAVGGELRLDRLGRPAATWASQRCTAVSRAIRRCQNTAFFACGAQF